MLRRMCKWLRFMGYDTSYPEEGLSDDDILKICEEEERTLLTRDKELDSRSQDSILIKYDNLTEQLHQFTSLFDVQRELYFTRCPECNSLLRETDSSESQIEVPDSVMRKGMMIWICTGCGKHYWQGSHYDKILSKLEELEVTRK